VPTPAELADGLASPEATRPTDHHGIRPENWVPRSRKGFGVACKLAPGGAARAPERGADGPGAT